MTHHLSFASPASSGCKLRGYSCNCVPDRAARREEETKASFPRLVQCSRIKMTSFTSLRAIRGLSRSSLALTSRSNGGGCRWNANIMSAQRGLGSLSGGGGTGGVSSFARDNSFQHTSPDRTMSTSTATAAYDQLVDVFPSLIIGANGSIAPQGSFAEAQAQVSYREMKVFQLSI